jgi:hypothetical protein
LHQKETTMTTMRDYIHVCHDDAEIAVNVFVVLANDDPTLNAQSIDRLDDGVTRSHRKQRKRLGVWLVRRYYRSTRKNEPINWNSFRQWHCRKTTQECRKWPVVS